MYRNFLALIILILTSITEGYSQSANILSAGAGVQNSVLRDNSLSPLIHSGTGFYTNIAYYYKTNAKTRIFLFDFSQKPLKNKFGRRLSCLNSSIKNYTFYNPEGAEDRRMIFGWSNNNVLINKESEAFMNFNETSHYFTSFGPAAAYSYPFQLFSQYFYIDIYTDIQLAGFYLGPSFLGGAPKGYIDRDNSPFQAFIKSINLFCPGKAWNFSLIPKLTYSLKSGNSISLEYRYEYIELNTGSKFVKSSGKWLFSLNAIL